MYGSKADAVESMPSSSISFPRFGAAGSRQQLGLLLYQLGVLCGPSLSGRLSQVSCVVSRRATGTGPLRRNWFALVTRRICGQF